MEMKYHSRAVPSIPVTSKDFHYTPAVQTDVTETWRKFGWVPTTKRGNINKPVMGKTK
jgi:hypothetical protein